MRSAAETRSGASPGGGGGDGKPNRRRLLGVNAVVATVLVATLAALVNAIGFRIYGRMPIASHLYGELTERTIQVLGHIEGDLQLIAFFENGHPLAAPVRALLQEFAEAARPMSNLRIKVKTVDPNRDVAVASDLARRYAVERNCLIVLTGDRHRVITPAELVITHEGEGDEAPQADFAGETSVVAAIWNTTRSDRPTVYFLTGHGEHDPLDFDRLNGYSGIARTLRRNWYEVRNLELTPGTPFPENCALLVVAGPRTTLSSYSMERIGAYMASGGRMLLLLDNASDTGLSSLLKDWGVEVLPPVKLPESGNSVIRAGLPVGRHAVTRGLSRAEVTLEAPCRFAISPEALEPEHADKPRATPLLSSGSDARRLLGERSDESLAVAVERGADAREEHGYLARVMVVGDAQFAANALVDGGLDSNREFFMSGVHWLTEQEALIGRVPVTYRILRSGISRRSGWRRMALLVVVGWPFTLWSLGMALTYKRRSAIGRL